ncbi:MAG: right-handed parallel beta-helix repeat-containing protein [Bacteroidota bacterium]|nr:right-handed parallel beta-helix repeat-containing protein [Bacteroidota bacterium]
MPHVIILVLLALLSTPVLQARILPVGPGEYATLEAAAAEAQPGDTIMFRAGTHAGGAWVSELRGTAQQWITIMGDPTGETLISGGSNAFQISDPAYLRISGLLFDGQTGNGVNIDDGGSYDTPAMHIVIERCTWRGINATGNNDMLKMSGVDNFIVRDCVFRNGSPGGSMIDMVGCHDGSFERNRFENGGSNCIQAKGGTRRIRITRNLFLGGGQRAINIGGSTGLAYFRPQDADYEAMHISVFANIFTGAVAPIAYVGAVYCEVFNNTMYLPEKWAVRILQENTHVRFQPCGMNTFVNNLVYLDNRAAAPSFNIGPDTRPETFVLMNNLWFNAENANWSGPNAPVTDMHMILGEDPRLAAPALRDGDFTPRTGSPAIGAGTGHTEQILDFRGHLFRSPPSIGAVEGDTTTQYAHAPSLPRSLRMQVSPHPVRGDARLRIAGREGTRVQLRLYDLRGRRVPGTDFTVLLRNGVAELPLSLGERAPGWYVIIADAEGRSNVQTLLLVP